MVGEYTPTGRMLPTGYGKRTAEYTREFKDNIKQKMLQEYKMDSIRLIKYGFSNFDFEFTLTDSPEPAKEEEKMVGAITTATPNITRVSYSQRRKKRGKEDKEE